MPRRWSHAFFARTGPLLTKQELSRTVTSSPHHNPRSHQLLQLPSFGLQDDFNNMYVQALPCWSRNKKCMICSHHTSRNCQKNLPWPGKDVGHQKCYCIFSLIYSFHQRNPRDSAPDNVCNLQPQNLNFAEGEKVGVWKFISEWLLNPRIRNLKGSFEAASEKRQFRHPVVLQKAAC